MISLPNASLSFKGSFRINGNEVPDVYTLHYTRNDTILNTPVMAISIRLYTKGSESYIVNKTIGSDYVALNDTTLLSSKPAVAPSYLGYTYRNGDELYCTMPNDDTGWIYIKEIGVGEYFVDINGAIVDTSVGGCSVHFNEPDTIPLILKGVIKEN